MEIDPTPDTINPLVRAAARFISELTLVKEQLELADLNPHEGRLRATVAPVVYTLTP